MIDPKFFKSLGPLTGQKLIEGLSVSAEGPLLIDELSVHSAAPLATSQPGDVSYLENRKALKDLKSAKASACFVKPDFVQDVIDAGMVALVCDQPRGIFSHVLNRLFHVYESQVSEETQSGPHISPTAFVAKSAQIGEGSVIGHGSVIGPNVQIGNHVKIGNNVSIDCAIIGNNVRVKSSTVIGTPGFGIAFDGRAMVDIPHLGRVLIDDNVSVGANCAIDRGMMADTVIGAGTKFDNLVQVAHGVTIGKNCLFASQIGISGSCVIGDGVSMGGRVGIADHIHIGDGAQLAGGSGVMKNIPAGEVWSGYPAKPIKTHFREVAMISRLVKAPKNK